MAANPSNPLNKHAGLSNSVSLTQMLGILQHCLQTWTSKFNAYPGITTRVTILTEVKNELDYWKRQLGYIILPNGECLNEVLLMNGYAKASQNYYCSKLPEYQLMNRKAQIEKAGLYRFIERF